MGLNTMSDIGLRSRMLVKDVMSSPVITIDENAPANQVAELMDKHGLGCIIVTGKEVKPLGIIMTTPLITIEPDEKISEAARRMSGLNIRRLGVVYKEQLVGVLSSKDLLAVMPELIEIIQEQALIEGENRAQEAEDQSTALAGYCDRCGVWSDDLKEANGDFLCEDCRAEFESEA